MSSYRFLVTYEGTIEAPDPETARAWANEEVAHGIWPITHTEVERIAHEHERARAAAANAD